MSESLVLLGIVIVALGGLPGLVFGRNSMGGQWLTTLLAVVGSGLGLWGLGSFWLGGDGPPIDLPWSLMDAHFTVDVDGLSAIFLGPIFLIPMLGNIYGLGYWRQTENPENGRQLGFFYGAFTASMALAVIARNSIVFLFGWEIMALTAFFLVSTEDRTQEVREAGWLFLVVTHTATLCLFALFALLRVASGSFALVPGQVVNLSPGMATAVFVLGLIGFGSKSGIMPLHVWLPSAHSVAPSHVSAIMSGVKIKVGIYSLLLITSFVPRPPLAWGVTLLGLGVVSGVLGIVFAIGQRDLKRLLAYSSIENIGIILIGIGLALIGRSLHQEAWVVLGLGGALLHVINHALFKSMLFLCAGSVIHATHTREIDKLGGLAKVMPWTSLCFVVGAIAVCGFPPLNGFISEFLIYLGLFHTLGIGQATTFAGASFAAPALALIGTLAVVCFVKLYGAVFLGTARTDYARHAHESPVSMLVPMGLLAACCALIGLAPFLVAPILQQGIATWAPELSDVAPRLVTVAPLARISAMSMLLTVAILVASLGLRFLLGRSAVSHESTWGCGDVAPTPRIQYTSSSFAQMVVEMFAWALRPRTRRPGHLPLFPRAARFESHVPDVVLDDVILPAVRAGGWLFSWFRVFQSGNLQVYLLYIFVALIALLLWR